jgi:hypothetical protein
MKVIYEHTSYKITVEEKLRGTNGPLYQHIDASQKIKHLIRPLSFTLEKEGKTIGTCTFLERNIRVQEKVYKAWYSRYFSIAPEYQGKIFGNLLLKNIKSYYEQITDMPTVFYGFVDQANPRSGKLLKNIGLEIIRSFEIFVFSRVYPKTNKQVTRIREEDKEKLLELLRDQYSDYTFVNFEHLFFQDNYFVLKINNEIVAGIRANNVQWIIRHLPGISGKIMMQLLPHTPFISRLFNPKDFRFVEFEGIYCKPGHEKDLFILMESVCAELKLCTGMIWIDPKSELYDRIKKAGNWGIINKLKDNVPAHVVAAFRNIPEKEQKVFQECPVYISAFDLT